MNSDEDRLELVSENHFTGEKRLSIVSEGIMRMIETKNEFFDATSRGRRKHIPMSRLSFYFLSFLALVFAALLLWWLPKYEVSTRNKSTMTEYQVLEAENSIRGTLATAIGGLLVLIGAYVAWRNLTVAEGNLAAVERGQLTERFTRAIEQLGASSDDGRRRLEIRIGGIFGLEKIASDDPDGYHDTVMEVLTAYLRENHPWPSTDFERDSVPVDLQAVAAVIRRRRRWWNNGEQAPLDLRRTDLRGLDLAGAHLESADFTLSCLEGAILTDAFLQDAILTDSRLLGAFITGSSFINAELTLARFSGIDCSDVDFSGADLIATRLDGCDLSRSTGLTSNQIASAHMDDHTLLPDFLKPSRDYTS